MKLRKFLIAKGNSTLLVWDCSAYRKKGVIKKYLGRVEQIGFVETKENFPFLNMMGNELCVNGTLALAFLSGPKGKLFTSGLKNPVLYNNIDGATSVDLAINYQRFKNIVLLEGIGYIFLKEKKENVKEFLKNLCVKYDLAAFGIIYYRQNRIEPIVYVKQTNSLFEETACGSGSIAFSILTKKQNIIQPTGKEIRVEKYENIFCVSAEVEKL